MGYKKEKVVLTPMGEILDRLSKVEKSNNYKVMSAVGIKDFIVYGKYLIGEIALNTGQLNRILQVFEKQLTDDEILYIEERIDEMIENQKIYVDFEGLTEEEIELVNLLVIQLKSRKSMKFYNDVMKYLSNYGDGGSTCRKIPEDKEVEEMPF